MGNRGRVEKHGVFEQFAHKFSCNPFVSEKNVGAPTFLCRASPHRAVNLFEHRAHKRLHNPSCFAFQAKTAALGHIE